MNKKELFVLLSDEGFVYADQCEIDAEVSDELKRDAAVGRAIREHLDSGAYEAEITITHHGNDDVVAITIADGEKMHIGNGTDARTALVAAGLIEKENAE